jgi:ABC-type antimicrobial peptide transport system permease subunit
LTTLVIVLVMSVLSAISVVRRIAKADPAELY